MNDSILSTINGPADLKNLPFNKLGDLASELRQRIIEVLAVNGGHLGSNLGAVELTLALHKVFDSPDDKFIWDVSHQTYVHKLLTGRKELFHKIRQYKGLCGFSNPKESTYDHFYAGHAGTALSLALGVAKTRDLQKGQEHIIPIIGDATLTCGMSLEALNNVSKDLGRFIIILNDNAMSISKNVGAITQILSRLLSNPTSNRLYHELDNILSKIPGYGSVLSKQGHKITESLKNLFSSAAFFEQYGVSYIGPIDGHDIKKMVETFEAVRDTSWPVLIHVHTKKGLGLDEAIKNPVSYHGARPFDRGTGKFHPTISKNPTFPKVFGAHLLHMAEADPSVVAVTPAMSAGSCLDDFMRKFPDRCIDVGIAESHAITFSGGLAYGGKMKVVASIYSTFLQRAFDNLFHDVCLQGLPVVFAIDRAGISGPDGSTHHGIYDISFLNAMPNMIISQPRNGQVLKELLGSAFSWGSPAAIRYPNMMTEDYEGPLAKRNPGAGEVLAQGKEILLIALGHMNLAALKVREILQTQGIEITVMDPVFVKPLDSELLSKLMLTHSFVVTLEEHSVVSGMGSIVNNFLMVNGYGNAQVLNLGIPETFIEQGSHAELMDDLGLTPDKIAKKILELHKGLKNYVDRSEHYDHSTLS
jgi:1-deoxy-D-xylulose-5-phosphate synthase